MTCDGERCGPGTHIELPYGAAFGPFVAGDQGVELYEVMMGDPRSWSDEPEVMQRLLAARGVEQLPDPPIELPAGLADLRAVFGSGAKYPAVVARRDARGSPGPGRAPLARPPTSRSRSRRRGIPRTLSFEPRWDSAGADAGA